MARPWRYVPHDQNLIKTLSNGLSISPLTAQVLIARGIRTVEEARVFLGGKLTDLHPPEALPGVMEAADRVVEAIRAGRRITIYGDYDVDGITSTAILWHALSLHRAKVDYYIPCRLEEGYGLNSDAIRKLHEEDPDQLVITVDCGIASVAEAALARELGLELIITDHHTFGEELPAATALVHPRLPETEWPDTQLCGAGVAFKLAWGICKRLAEGERVSERVRDFLTYEAVSLACCGTVADVVPLVGENRLLVRYGLQAMNMKPGAGLSALMKISNIDGQSPLTAEDIAFKIAPRINAAGRLGQPKLGVELLTTDQPDRAQQIADYLDQLNADRKRLERKIFQEAKDLVKSNEEWLNAPALVLADANWHPGVIGIVASRVAERFEKPAIMISLDREAGTGQGSGRSYAGFDLHGGLTECAEHLVAYGGHRAAAGLRIEASAVDAFREAFCQAVANGHEPTEADVAFAVDAEVLLSEVTSQAVFELDRLGPFGQGNPRPAFVASDVSLAAPPKTMGEGGRHVALQVKQFEKTMRAIAFGRGEWAEEMANLPGPFHIHFAAEINRWQGRMNIELRLKDWKAVDQTVPSA
ncbi:single-stranded-DNA-specific exonuclease RecJ [Calycomorphotria hydatis]|uniref:Single-stranded-DNA-specific exonuclease RecJ n=1 Tax=Calycomorphotria hydatis TaxID=2528027 RepID=A0A517T9Q8_9PLAN|nr:single-stranded-DNA-specific exonuclease RecJ [Calycomorphotria hydatis]QDT65103.1 Single-stranded-DNA-specific exonuclease RecJ [Calycomorphotria hydatis]